MVFTFGIVIFAMLFGACCFYFTKGYKAVLLAALLPWSVFLIINLYSEFFSHDREIMQGSWLVFQATIGSVVAISGVAGGWIINKVLVKFKRE